MNGSVHTARKQHERICVLTSSVDWGLNQLALHLQMELTTMEGVLGHVIHNLSVSSVYEDGSCVDPQVPAVSISRW